MQDFKGFNFPENIERALQKMDHNEPTPIQAKAIPLVMDHKDVIGCAQTGTGKTAAFILPLVAQLIKSPRKCGLVIVPTRELADQVASVAREITVFTKGIETAVVIGGVSMGAQVRALQEGPKIIIATPGRLVDHLRRGTASLRSVEYLVLDEADRMLDMGFLPFINEILRFIPATRQTLLFSATMAPEVMKVAKKYMRNPVRVDAGVPDRPADNVNQKMVNVNGGDKRKTLNNELFHRAGSVLIFTRTKYRADDLCRFLVTNGHEAGRIHGGRTQGQRTKTLNDFRTGRLRVLVATDVVSRGIDISNIGHVINFDIPRSPEDYVHRIGRTARAGAEGQALSLVSPEEKSDWNKIHLFLKKQKIQIPAHA